MSLPLYTRASALVVALSTTAAIIVTVAEIGLPPPDGRGAIASLLLPQQKEGPAVAVAASSGAPDSALMLGVTEP